MFPYGWKHGLWRDEDYGPPSRYRRVRHRKAERRVLRKRERAAARKEVAERARPLLPEEDLFVCRRCHTVSQEQDRCLRTGECIYC